MTQTVMSKEERGRLRSPGWLIGEFLKIISFFRRQMTEFAVISQNFKKSETFSDSAPQKTPICIYLGTACIRVDISIENHIPPAIN